MKNKLVESILNEVGDYYSNSDNDMEERIIRVTPDNPNNKGQYIIKTFESNGLDGINFDIKYNKDKVWYTMDLWTGGKWLFADTYNTPVVEIVDYVPTLSDKELKERLDKLNNIDRESEKERYVRSWVHYVH